MSHKILVIQGGFSKEGSCSNAVKSALGEGQYDQIDLVNEPFIKRDPTSPLPLESFAAFSQRMLQYDSLLLATPVYWYGPSTLMKIFLDRWNSFREELCHLRPEVTELSMGVLAVYSAHPEGKKGVELPFKLFSKYFGMTYKGTFFFYAGSDPSITAQNTSTVKAIKDAYI